MATLREKMRARGELLLAHSPIINLGCTVVSTLSLMTLATATVLSIVLQTSRTEGNTSVGNTSGRSANLEEVSAESLQKVIGSGIMGHVQNSKRTSNSMEKSVFPEKSSHFMGHQEGSTMKKQDNFFFTTF